MRVGILSYPMLFQRQGGLQIQVRETLRALGRRGGIHAELVDTGRARLDDYDLVHVFSAINGNHRIVEAAAGLGVPVVLSPLVSPGWNRAHGARARLGDRLLGKFTGWNVQTSYGQIRRALDLAGRVIALGEAERDAIVSGFLTDAGKIRVFPNGVDQTFFGADPALFRERFATRGPFALSVAAISPYKNQLGLARAMATLDLPLVVIGSASGADAAYRDEVRQMPGVTLLDAMDHDDPLLASAFAAASVFALPSVGEVFPLTVLEALAAGTPVVMTSESALRLENSAFAVRKVAWNNELGLAREVADLVARPPARQQVRTLVRHLTWERVAAQIAGCYGELLPAAAMDGARAV